MPTRSAQVYLIGAGPGDPGLLTLRGKQCLEAADVVLYDYLAGEELLQWIRPEAESYCLGRHGKGKIWTQTQINERMVAEALAGKTVARLKGGDPNIFGRLAEEVEALTQAGLTFEIVPGVTTAVAAGAYAGVTITHRDQASCVAFVTGQERPGKPETAIDYAALAAFPGTLVFYMGVTNAPHWSAKLQEHGKPASTPVVLVRRCSLPDQSTITCTLGELPDVLAPGKVRPPLVAIVGDVAASEAAASWFNQRPLFGQTVLITRPAEQAKPMLERIASLGAETLLQPAIEITPPADAGPLAAAIDELGKFDWIVFSSRNGVEHFMRQLLWQGKDARSLGPCRLAAIGPATSEALAEYHLQVDLAPKEYRAEALAEALAADAAGKAFLLVRASRGREVLAEQLTAAGGEVTQVVAYESQDVAETATSVAERLQNGEIDWVTVTSSAIARSLVQLFGDALHCTKLVAISPLTAGVLTELGYPPAAVAETYTGDGVVEALLAAVSKD